MPFLKQVPVNSCLLEAKESKKLIQMVRQQSLQPGVKLLSTTAVVHLLKDKMVIYGKKTCKLLQKECKS